MEMSSNTSDDYFPVYDEKIEDFETICGALNVDTLYENFTFLYEHTPDLFDAYSSMIDFAYHASTSLAIVRELQRKGKYADYVIHSLLRTLLALIYTATM